MCPTTPAVDAQFDAPGRLLSGGKLKVSARPLGVTRPAALKQPSGRVGARVQVREVRVIAEPKASELFTATSVIQTHLNAKSLIYRVICTWGGVVQILLLSTLGVLGAFTT